MPKDLPKLPPRERILAAADELFYRDGIRGVGVEAIAAHAGTTKMGIYRHFANKDALVAEWLRLESQAYSDVLDRLKSQHPEDAKAQLLGWAQFIASRLAIEADRGCCFANSVAELPDRAHPAWVVIEAHSRDLSERLIDLCTQAGLAEPEHVASEIIFILDGAQLAAQSRGDAQKVGERLVSIVRRLVQ
ncbi:MULTISPECIES: TetR/AcrR family transcriptional regulator [Pseudomonas]|jgi:AcrR family transcriptional regulator|uniref:TetR/AcrR family transcriptional regulator n=1 Tax=Pseudomonas TaxID=286 RepID=UPI00062B126C|nr:MULTISPECIES: TetR/AcrR family transcriptional regulator [Pseudomonas]KKX62390.1 TetR family transcriptional regulator [Pseudomonas putida]SER12047.1 transcriptional regulator, TetR family [Pseudomonas sp. NFACC02]